MCECGCSIGNERYRFPGPKEVLYVVELYQGCRDCAAPPGITIYRVGKDHYMRDEIEDMPSLPFIAREDSGECPIKFGPDAFAKAVREQKERDD